MTFTENITARPIAKHPLDAGVYVASFLPWICEVTLVSIVSIQSDSPELVVSTVSSSSIVGSAVAFTMSGGVDCKDYIVTIGVKLADTGESIIHRVFPVKVRSK